MDYVGLLPFAVFVALFLLWPTVLVVFGAFQDPERGPTLPTSCRPPRDTYLQTFVTSTVLSAVTAVLGAVFGGLWRGRSRSDRTIACCAGSCSLARAPLPSSAA